MSEFFGANISQWVHIFAEAYKQNPDGFNLSNNIFSEKMKSDLPSFISICNEILILPDGNDENTKKAQELSLNFIFKLLDFQHLTELSEKRSIITEEISEQIKNSLKQNLFSENQTICNLCIKNYSLLFSILSTNWEEGINDIIDLFSNLDLLPYGFIVLLSVMKEIINNKNFLTDIFPHFSEQFTQVLVISIDFLSKEQNEQDFVPELRIEACKYIYNVIKFCPEIFNESEVESEVDSSKILSLLEIMPNSFEINDLNLYECLIDILNIIVEKFYSKSENFMDIIATYILNGIELIKIDEFYAYLSIRFWNRVANFENNVIEKVQYLIKTEEEENIEVQPLQPLLSEMAFDLLIQFFVNYVELIDEEDITVENKERSKVHTILVSTIKSIYKIVPTIFDTIIEIIDDQITKEKWINIYSGILLIFTICDDPIDDEVGTFLISKMDFLIENSIPDQIPRIRYNSLLVIGLIFQNYPHLILQQDEDDDKWINELIEISQSIFKIDKKNISEDDWSIFERYVNIIYNVSTLWYYSESNESNLSLYFDKFYEILSTLFEFSISNNYFDFVEKSSEALNRMISYSTSEMANELSELYEKTLDELLELKNSLLDEETVSFGCSCYCSNLTTILLGLKNNCEIISQFSEQTIQVLFEILEIYNVKLWKETFWTIASLIISANSSPVNKIIIFTPYTFNLLYDNFINNAFLSDDPELIRSTCCLISNIYLYLYKKMDVLHQLIPDIFEILDVFLNEKDMKDSYPFILDAISNILFNVEQNDELIIQLEPSLYELIMNLIDLSNDFDISNENEIEYENLFYQYLSDVIRNYLKVFHDSEDLEHEKNQINLLDNLAFFVNKLFPRISNDLYGSFLSSAKEFASKCSKNNRNILNSHSIHKLMGLSIENCSNPDFCEEKKKVDELLKQE